MKLFVFFDLANSKSVNNSCFLVLKLFFMLGIYLLVKKNSLPFFPFCSLSDAILLIFIGIFSFIDFSSPFLLSASIVFAFSVFSSDSSSSKFKLSVKSFTTSIKSFTAFFGLKF